jgi:DNA replication protein DnaC
LEKNLKAFNRKATAAKGGGPTDPAPQGQLLDHKENVLAFRTHCGGKTHLLCAVAQELVHQGRQVRYMQCSLLVQELLIAKRDLKLARALKQYARYEALIIDDIGYVQQSREEMEVIFTLLADRYERSSVMITSNRTFSKQEQIFKDPMTTAAAIDRLVHHCVILELNIPSYRLEESTGNNS